MMGVARLLFPDYALIAAGAVLRRLDAFPPAFWAGLERLVYYLLFPALLVRSLAGAPLFARGAWTLVAVVVAATLLAMALALPARRLFGLAQPAFAASFQCAFRFNTYVVLAVASRLGGAESLALASLLVGVLVPIVNVAAVAMLAHGRDTPFLRELVRNPLLLACAAGIALNAAGIALPGWIDALLAELAHAAVPLGLIAVGAALHLARDTLPAGATLWFHAIKLGALPALAWLLCRHYGLDVQETAVAVLFCAVPTASSTYILATQMGGDGRAAAWLITSGTLAAGVTLPLWIALVT